MAKFSTKKLGQQIEKWKSGYTGYNENASKSMSNSSFWLGSDFLEDKAAGVDFVKLAGYKRAIANFVRIVTGKDDISVNYSSGRQSYTDGKTVVISSKLDEKEFDSTVGLALHEGSHIALTDFKRLKKLLTNTDNIPYENLLAKYSGQKGAPVKMSILKDLINIIEDRRIDAYIYKSAPGYQGYYQALYDKYFNDKAIDAALKLGLKSDPTIENYLFHICNFTNANRRLSALPGLRDIWNTINIKNISRLKTADDVNEVACAVYLSLIHI